MAAIVPARNEAGLHRRKHRRFGAAGLQGPWCIILVDDDSSDDTVETLRAGRPECQRAAAHRDQSSACRRMDGKLWAVKQGIDAAMAIAAPTGISAADRCRHRAPLRIRSAGWSHTRDRGLVLTLADGQAALPELRRACQCSGLHLLLPDALSVHMRQSAANSAVAAAAGGCMLVRADALPVAGGIEAIRGALIDDCALGQGPEARRADLARIDRHACQHARISALRGHPPHGRAFRLCAIALFAPSARGDRRRACASICRAVRSGDLRQRRAARIARASDLVHHGGAFQPTLRFYQLSRLWGFALPAIALEYILFTLDSAYQYVRGRGGNWKGRVQAKVSEL